MRIYKATVFDPDLGAMLSWHSSHKEAAKTVREARKEYGEPAQGPEGVTRVDFTPTRAGILDLLNQHTPSTDNG